MSSTHLSTGSQNPRKVAGKLRLYSNLLCPYVQRVRLVLAIKKIPHDVVNIDLSEKPEWYFSIHPEGKVPSIDIGSEIIIESLDISDYLDEKYPNPPLYPSDPQAKKQDKELIQKIGPLTGVIFQCLYLKTEKTPEEWVKEFTPHLEVFENELAKRATTFFGGEKPGMVDYMLWPWAERAGVIALSFGQKLPFPNDQFPLLKRWCKAVRVQPEVDAIYLGPEIFFKVSQLRKQKIPIDYNTIFVN